MKKYTQGNNKVSNSLGGWTKNYRDLPIMTYHIFTEPTGMTETKGHCLDACHRLGYRLGCVC